MTDGYVYVAEVNYADTTPAEQTEYHGTAALATGAAFTRAPNAFIADRLVTPEIPAEHLFQPRCTRGRRGNPRETQVRFRNRDGALDGWKSQAFQGRAFQLWRTTRANLGNFAQYLSAFAGTADQPAVDTNEVTLIVREAAEKLNRPVLTERYAGTNVLPNGLEGTADDIKGRLKPLILGEIRHYSPPCVNTSRWIFQMSCAVFTTNSLIVSVRGVALGNGVSVSYADLQLGYTALPCTFTAASTAVSTGATPHGITNGQRITFATAGTLPAYTVGATPGALSDSVNYYLRSITATTFSVHATSLDAQLGLNAFTFSDAGTSTHDVAYNRTARGTYDLSVDLTHGMFIRLGSKPDGEVTINAHVRPGGYAGLIDNIPAGLGATTMHPVGLIFELRRRAGSLPASSAYVDAIGVSAGATNTDGIVIDTDITFLEAIDTIAQRMFAGWYFEDGFESPLVLWELRDPAGETKVATLYERDLLDLGDGQTLQRVVSGDDDRGIPPCRINVYHTHNETVQTANEIAASATAAFVAFALQEWRVYTLENAGVLARFPDAPEINVYTGPREPDDYAARLQALYDPAGDGSVLRDMLEIEVAQEKLPTIRPGQCITLVHSRMGLSAGKDFQVLGVAPKYGRDGKSVVRLTIWG